MLETTSVTGENRFKAFELGGWQHSVEQYDRSFSNLTRQTIPDLLALVGITTCRTLLDIATGTGEVAAAAAAQGVRVLGVDFSTSMLERARSKHPEVTFIEGDAEALPNFEIEFDAAVMNFGLLHLGMPEKALAEAHRVIPAGGRFAFTVWAPPTEALGFQIALKAIEAHGDMSVSLPEGPPFFKYSDPEVAKQAVVAAGFSEPQAKKIPLKWRLTQPEELFEAFYRGTARTGGLLRAQSESQLVAIKGAMVKAVKEGFMANDGTVQIDMPAMVYAARK